MICLSNSDISAFVSLFFFTSNRRDGDGRLKGGGGVFVLVSSWCIGERVME